MNDGLDFELGDTSICRDAKRLGLRSFMGLAEYVRELPYRRTEDSDADAVLAEGCGTCSSKHRLLAVVAHESGHTNIRLTVGIYEMSERNTPGVGGILYAAALPFIPEAHCYLTIAEQRLDFTGLSAGEAPVFDSLTAERFTEPDELSTVKRAFHCAYLRDWARIRGLSLDRVWRVRESCIAALSANRPTATN